MSDTFCILPFIHLETRSDSFVAPCCMSQEFYRKETGELFSLSRDTLSDVWNSSSIKQLRADLLSGKKASACTACWKEEEMGKESKRIRENSRWEYTEEPSLKFLDLKLGNTCNLKCRICNPSSSSSWVKEHKDVYGVDLISVIGNQLDIDRKAIMQWPEYNDEFWEDLDSILPNIELFEIYGGEPFLIERHFEVLRKSVELGYSKNQRIHYNTNGTIFPQDAITNIWKHFKEVDIMLSIDGIDEQFEYQRYPAKWESVLNNINKFKEQFTGDLQICMTVSSLNVYYLPEYLEFFNNMNINVWLNMLYHPSVYSICNLNQTTKQKIIEKLQNNLHLNKDIDAVINYLNTTGSDLQQQFIERIRVHDAYRNQNFFHTFEEYGKIICEN